MKKFISLVLVGLALLLLVGCAPTATEQLLWHMDSTVSVRIYGGAAAAKEALSQCDELLGHLDKALSATDEQSPVFLWNASPNGAVALPYEVLSLIEKSLRISALCDGAFDVTTAPLTALWEACEDSGTLPTEEQLLSVLAAVGSHHLGLRDTALTKDAVDVRIDLGAIAKGYATDALVTLLRDLEGVTAAIVSFGSSVSVVGQKPDGTPWRIALRDPNGGEPLGYIHITEGQFLSTSGDYERYFTFGSDQYSHILDPKTGFPPENGLRSVAVLCADGATSDALSTALAVMGESAARELYESGALSFEAVFIYDDHLSTTDGITLVP